MKDYIDSNYKNQNILSDKEILERARIPPESYTTTSFNPSKLSDTSLNIISFIYENGGATTKNVCDFIEKPKSYVVRYLYNLRNYGLISKILKEWTLTKKGMEVLELLYKEKQAKKYYKNESMKHTAQVSPPFNKFHTINNIIRSKEEIINKTNQILHILSNKIGIQLDNSKEVVVRKLFAHSYESLGQKAIRFEAPYKNGSYLSPLLEASKFFGVEFKELAKAINELVNSNVLYYYEDKKGRFCKIGIKKVLYDTLAMYYPELELPMLTRAKKVMRLG
ncbi:MAG: hypothetical protein ACP5M7_09460 [Thermoproteota archaeon]